MWSCAVCVTTVLLLLERISNSRFWDTFQKYTLMSERSAIICPLRAFFDFGNGFLGQDLVKSLPTFFFSHFHKLCKNLLSYLPLQYYDYQTQILILDLCSLHSDHIYISSFNACLVISYIIIYIFSLFFELLAKIYSFLKRSTWVIINMTKHSLVTFTYLRTKGVGVQMHFSNTSASSIKGPSTISNTARKRIFLSPSRESRNLNNSGVSGLQIFVWLIAPDIICGLLSLFLMPIQYHAVPIYLEWILGLVER